MATKAQVKEAPKESMRAVRYIEGASRPQVMDVPTPAPGPGEVLVRIAGAGVCGSDLHVLDHSIGIKGSFTLGHENAGWIAAVGQGVSGWKEADAVAVYGPWGCGICHSCQRSAENYCEHHASLPSYGGGLGSDGGMAEYMIVPSPRLLIPLGKLEPVQAAPLSDAALTPYHAIKAALPLLTPDASVVVVGVGGLGHMAVQILRALTSARLIAADVEQAKLDHARDLGAVHTVNTSDGDRAVEEIRSLVGEQGVTVALDFVGVQPTVDLCSRIVGRASRITIVGLGGGVLHYSANQPPYGCEVSVPYWGSRVELMEVIALAQAGYIKADVETFPLGQAVEVYERLRQGRIRGRAVLFALNSPERKRLQSSHARFQWSQKQPNLIWMPVETARRSRARRVPVFAHEARRWQTRSRKSRASSALGSRPSARIWLRQRPT